MLEKINSYFKFLDNYAPIINFSNGRLNFNERTICWEKLHWKKNKLKGYFDLTDRGIGLFELTFSKISKKQIDFQLNCLEKINYIHFMNLFFGLYLSSLLALEISKKLLRSSPEIN